MPSILLKKTISFITTFFFHNQKAFNKTFSIYIMAYLKIFNMFGVDIFIFLINFLHSKLKKLIPTFLTAYDLPISP